MATSPLVDSDAAVLRHHGRLFRARWHDWCLKPPARSRGRPPSITKRPAAAASCARAAAATHRMNGQRRRDLTVTRSGAERRPLHPAAMRLAVAAGCFGARFYRVTLSLALLFALSHRAPDAAGAAAAGITAPPARACKRRWEHSGALPRTPPPMGITGLHEVIAETTAKLRAKARAVRGSSPMPPTEGCGLVSLMRTSIDLALRRASARRAREALAELRRARSTASPRLSSRLLDLNTRPVETEGAWDRALTDLCQLVTEAGAGGAGKAERRPAHPLTAPDEQRQLYCTARCGKRSTTSCPTACKFAPRHPHRGSRRSQPRPRASLRGQRHDYGPGIPPAYRETIFAPLPPAPPPQTWRQPIHRIVPPRPPRPRSLTIARGSPSARQPAPSWMRAADCRGALRSGPAAGVAVYRC